MRAAVAIPPTLAYCKKSLEKGEAAQKKLSEGGRVLVRWMEDENLLEHGGRPGTIEAFDDKRGTTGILWAQLDFVEHDAGGRRRYWWNIAAGDYLNTWCLPGDVKYNMDDVEGECEAHEDNGDARGPRIGKAAAAAVTEDSAATALCVLLSFDDVDDGPSAGNLLAEWCTRAENDSDICVILGTPPGYGFSQRAVAVQAAAAKLRKMAPATNVSDSRTNLPTY